MNNPKITRLRDNGLRGFFIRLTAQQYCRLKEKGEENGVSVSSLIRLAINTYLKGEAHEV